MNTGLEIPRVYDSVKENPPCEIIAAAVISAPSDETARLVEEEEEKHRK